MLKLQNVDSIAVCEPSESKKEILKELGADKVIDPLDNLTLEADIVIECVGRPESMELAFKSAGKGEQVLLFGVAAPDAAISVSPFEIFSKELTIKGSFINPFTHVEAISLIAKKLIDVQKLVSHQFTIEELPVVMNNFPQQKVSKGIVTYKF